MLKTFLIWQNDIIKFRKHFLSALIILFLGNLFINSCLGEPKNINQNNYNQAIGHHKTKTYKSLINIQIDEHRRKSMNIDENQ